MIRMRRGRILQGVVVGRLRRSWNKERVCSLLILVLDYVWVRFGLGFSAPPSGVKVFSLGFGLWVFKSEGDEHTRRSIIECNEWDES